MRRTALASLVLGLLLAGCSEHGATKVPTPPPGAEPKGDQPGANGAKANDAAATTPAGDQGETAQEEPEEIKDGKDFIGQPAPKLEVAKWLSKEPKTAGKMVLVDFWATWCPPCKKLIPELNTWHKKYGDRLAIIGVTNETEEEVAAMETPKIQYAVGSDPDSKTYSQLEAKYVPYVCLIDPEGVMRWQGVGVYLKEPQLVALLDQYVPKAPAAETPTTDAPASETPAAETPATEKPTEKKSAEEVGEQPAAAPEK